MGIHCFCAQAHVQVDKSEIYLAISSYSYFQWYMIQKTFMKKNKIKPIYLKICLEGLSYRKIFHCILNANNDYLLFMINCFKGLSCLQLKMTMKFTVPHCKMIQYHGIHVCEHWLLIIASCYYFEENCKYGEYSKELIDKDDKNFGLLPNFNSINTVTITRLKYCIL